jgi:hypothetical protein
MKNEEGDINNNFGAILFIILFSLVALAFDGKVNNSASTSAYYSLQPDIALGFYSSHSDAIIFDTPPLPEVIKACDCSFYSPNLNLFNLQLRILYYNRSIVQKFMFIQKTGLSIEPSSVWQYSCQIATREKEDLPVLS